MNGFSEEPGSEAVSEDEPGVSIKFLEGGNSTSRGEGLEHPPVIAKTKVAAGWLFWHFWLA